MCSSHDHISSNLQHAKACTIVNGLYVEPCIPACKVTRLSHLQSKASNMQGSTNRGNKHLSQHQLALVPEARAAWLIQVLHTVTMHQQRCTCNGREVQAKSCLGCPELGSWWRTCLGTHPLTPGSKV